MAFTPFTKNDLPTMAAFNEKLQAIFDDAESKAKIEAGTYVGTGTYGEENPNTLTFGFEPKAVLFWSPDNKQTIAYVNGGTTIFGFYQNYGDDRDSATCSLSGNTLSWYASDARCQGNRIDTTYYYIAIG